MWLSAAWRDRCKRLATMGWDELYCRSRQEIAKRRDAAAYRLGLDFSSHHFENLPDAVPCFFFPPGDLKRVAALLHDYFPQEATHIVEQAQRICQHRFDLLGYEGLDYGQDIDWHLDVVHGKRGPRKPWFHIRFLDFAEVGDAKIIWELNRHQHLVTLAKAHCLTREERFAEELLRQWYHWQRQNSYPMGINWASSLEVAFRSLSWLWAWHLLAGCPLVPEHFQFDLLRALSLNGRHIERYLSTYSSPNTHLLGEGVGLFFIGTLCPQIPAARRWQQRGWDIVRREAERQVQSDGMHFEQSTYYHVYALDFFLHARILASCNQIPIPVVFDRTIEQMLEVLLSLGQAGALPRLGDDDGGRVFDGRRNRPEHLLDPLATGAILFNRADFKATAGGLREESLWLLGPAGVTQFERIPATIPQRTSVGLEASGIYVMSSAGPEIEQLVVDAGPQGSGCAGHGHADALSIHLAVNGDEWLIDPGTFTYVGSAPERDTFRGTAAHNTMQVDACSQAEPTGPFAWHPLPSTRVQHWVAGEMFDFFAGCHTGYGRLAEPVVHWRWVFYLKSRFWLVRDLARGEGTHRLDLFWHFAPHFLDWTTVASTTVLAKANKHALAVLSAEGHGWEQEVSPGWWSPVYGRKEPSPVLRFTTQATLPVEFVTLLLPLAGVSEELGVLARTDSGAEDGVVRGYRYSSSHGCDYFFFSECEKSWELGRWASDAPFLYYGRDSKTGGYHLISCGGSFIEVDGQRVVDCGRRVTRCEWLSTGETTRVYCSDSALVSHLSAAVLAMAKALAAGERTVSLFG